MTYLVKVRDASKKTVVAQAKTLPKLQWYHVYFMTSNLRNVPRPIRGQPSLAPYPCTRFGTLGENTANEIAVSLKICHMTSFWPLRPPNDEKKGSDFGEKARDRQLFIFHPKNDKIPGPPVSQNPQRRLPDPHSKSPPPWEGCQH